MDIKYPPVTNVYVGHDYHIIPSYGYAGIISGEIRIERLIHFHEVPRDHGQAWWDADMQDIPDINEKHYSEVLDDKYEMYVGLWVEYTYPNEEEQGECYMPIELFKEHIREI